MVSSRRGLRRIPGMESGVMPLWLLQISLSHFRFQKGRIMLQVQSFGSHSEIHSILLVAAVFTQNFSRLSATALARIPLRRWCSVMSPWRHASLLESLISSGCSDLGLLGKGQEFS